MMLPEGIPPLLFVLLLQGSCTSSDKELITVFEKTQTAYEGSSVTIPCSYKKTTHEAYTLLWFKDPEFDNKTGMFNGTIVYSNTEERPPSPGYSNREKYIIDTTSQINKRICNLRITDLQTTDSGNYSFRFIGKDIRYMSKALSLRVEENPCKVQIEPSKLKNPLNESEEFTVDCSTSGSCDHYPEWLVQTSGQKQEWTSTLSTNMITETKEGEEGRKVTKLTLKATWKDDNRTLSCRPANIEDSWQIRNITLFVEHAPKETKVTVSSEDVKEGDSVTLSCTSRGHPNVSFTWFKKEKVEVSQQMPDFKLMKVKPEDSGEYYCEAKNKHGAEKSNITINVKYGPKEVTVESQGNIDNLREGDNMTLKCSVKKSNPPVNQFTWYKNNQMLQQTNEILTIIMTPDDKGPYYCKANNGIKTADSNQITVSVKYSPRNIKIEGTTYVKVGTQVTLTCLADANPEPYTYTWKHTPGLSSVPLSETKWLNIQNVTIQHAGQYMCDVTNTIGKRSNTTKLDVHYRPSNLSLMMKGEVREFEVMSIICIVQSFPVSELTVTGPLGDQRNIQDKQRNTSQSTNRLTVYLNPTESDAGEYTCTAKNQEGKDTIKKELKVLYAPKHVTVSIKGEPTFGSELTLTCEARANPDLSSYEWKKRTKGQLKHVEEKHERLHFHSLEISDSGQYYCIAHNSIGKTASPSVDIKVKYAPNINIVHNMTTLTQWNGEFPVYLTCNVNAYPPAADYKWFKEEDNTTVLSNDQNFTVQPQNPGMYYCTAANVIGKSRSENIKLFISNNSLMVLYQIILPIILLLILIVIAIFLIRRTIIKARSDQQNEADTPLCFFPVFLSRSSTLTNLLLLGSRNNTQENLSVESIPDSGYERINQSHPTPNSHDPTPAEDLNPRPKSNIQTVYAAIKLPQMKHTKHSPKQQKTDNGAATLNYVTLDFKGKNEAEKRVSEGSAIYTVVSKNKQTTNSQSENPDYENVSSTCVQKVPFTNTDWESDTSEEDEVNYTAVSCSAKPAVKEPKHNQKRQLSSSSSDDEDRTEYSAVKL